MNINILKAKKLFSLDYLVFFNCRARHSFPPETNYSVNVITWCIVTAQPFWITGYTMRLE